MPRNWALELKRIKRDYQGSEFMPFQKLEESHLNTLKEGIVVNIGGKQQRMDERVKQIPLHGGLRSLEAEVNKVMKELDGKFVQLNIHAVGLITFCTLVYIPNTSTEEMPVVHGRR